MEEPHYTGPLDAVLRLPALRGVVVGVAGLFGGLFVLVAGLEGEAEGLWMLAAVLVGTLGVIVAAAWRPIATWQRVRAAWPDAEVAVAEVRVLNWDPFKQRRWTVLSPWNGAYHRARWLLLEDRIVWLGLQGIPWPDSQPALPVHPVELVPVGARPMTGLPHAVVQPAFDRETKALVAGRYRVADPFNRSDMVLVIRSHADAFAERFAGA